MADLVLGLAKTVVEGTMTAVRSAMEEDEKLHKSVQRDLMLISDEFEMMHSFLSNAAANSDGVVVTDEVSRTCVRQVRDMALDVEDCIEEVVHLDNDPGWWRRLLPRKLAAAGPVVALDDAVARVELLKTRIEAMGQRNMRYGTGGSSSSKAAVDQELMDVANNMMMTTTIGTAAEKKGGGPVDLVTLISKQQEDAAAAPAPLRVIAVVGEAAGTMSVIKKAYDDPTARAKFGCRAWVKLMHPFSPHEFIRSLLAQFCDTYCRAPSSSSSSSGVVDLPEPMDITVSKEDQLIKVMKQLMCNERYLVVLENVPTIVDWEAVRVYLPDKRNGSCILVHTQLVEVARLCVGDPHRRSEVQNYWAAAPTVYAFFKEVRTLACLVQVISNTTVGGTHAVGGTGARGRGFRSVIARRFVHRPREKQKARSDPVHRYTAASASSPTPPAKSHAIQSLCARQSLLPPCQIGAALGPKSRPNPNPTSPNDEDLLRRPEDEEDSLRRRLRRFRRERLNVFRRLLRSLRREVLCYGVCRRLKALGVHLRSAVDLQIVHP